jgi:hypothetical protein
MIYRHHEKKIYHLGHLREPPPKSIIQNSITILVCAKTGTRGTFGQNRKPFDVVQHKIFDYTK